MAVHKSAVCNGEVILATCDVGNALDTLKTIVGTRGWLGFEDAQKYFVDPRDRMQGYAPLVLMPKSTLHVSEILGFCNSAKLGIVPFGGGTGGVCGHIATREQPSIVLSLERMNSIRSLDIINNSMTVEAGCILKAVQEAARINDRRFGLSLASEGSCQIGGNLASNAGGIQVLRYGNTRDLCLGIEAVMPDGSILNDLQTVRKNNTGYDLRHLLIGSEGTLGVITAAALKLLPLPKESISAMVSVRSPDSAVELLHFLGDRLGGTLSAFELMSYLGVKLAVRYFPAQRDPFSQRYSWYVIMDIEGREGIRLEVENCLATAFESDLVLDSVIGQSEAQRNQLWQLRELAYEYNKLAGAFCSSDTAVPIDQINTFITRVTADILCINSELRINTYGHIGDGNIHINVFPPEHVDKADFLKAHPHIQKNTYECVNEVTQSCGGSISAEHGIGRMKTADLLAYGDPTKLSLMRAIKQAIDPNGIMNPGAVL